MFSKKLESLIQATLEDGILEDYEKEALIKRAQNEGVDLTELEIYINSILQKRKRELEQQRNVEFSEIEKKKKEEFGKICPACGKQVPSLSLNCECGYEFKKNSQESAVKLLSEKIRQIQSRKLKGTPDSEEWEADKKLRDQEMLDAISMFPVPNTKEDIMEFLSMSVPKAQKKGGIFGTVSGRIAVCLCILVVIMIVVWLILPGSYTETHVIDGGLLFDDEVNTETVYPSRIALPLIAIVGIIGTFLISTKLDTETLRWNRSAVVWKAKFEQVLMKGRSLRADAEFTKMLDYYENQMRSNEIASKKIFGI